ncbi:MAG: Cob-chelat-sub: cobaltochelatase subunit [Firmicutes bacterium]|nr:Cob-chelat-sub: cobaltochelatase subunit [Bacillota bacterium]
MSEYYRLIRHQGNQSLFQVVEMSVTSLVNEQAFHIQAEGLRGTGKTTIMRAARALLPPITRIKNCVYNCDPAKPHCPLHRQLSLAEIAALGTEQVPRPFLEISQAAKPGTVVGSIDLAKLTDTHNPLAALLPGTIPQAHRGIIFIDEINRLVDTAPELADVLLDVMGTRPGRVQIEEAGLPVVELPVTVCVWAAANPDEDPGALCTIRKQLADRFDVTVAMGRPVSEQAVIHILAGDTGSRPVVGSSNGISLDLDTVSIGEEVRRLLAKLYIIYKLESLRTVIAMETAARLNALQAGRNVAGLIDLVQVAPWTLKHRVGEDILAAIMAYLAGLLSNQPAVMLPASESIVVVNQKKATYWSLLWSSIKNKLASLRHSQSRLPGCGRSSQANGGGAQFIDPLHTKIIAPPKSAMPLSRLPDEQLVTRDSQPHG